MAIGTENAFSGPYTANGVTTEFPFTFSVLADTQAAVMLVDADGVQTEADINDYSVTLNGTVPTDGTVVFTTAPASGYEVIPFLDMPFTQETQFTDGSAWKAGPANNANDRAALRDQQLKREVDRAIKVPFGETGLKLPSATDRAGGYLAFDVDGNIVASEGTGSDAALRSDLAANTGAGLIGTQQGISVADKLGQYLSVLDFKEPTDADDSAALVKAGAASALSGIEVLLPDTLLLSETWVIPEGARFTKGLVSPNVVTEMLVSPEQPGLTHVTFTNTFSDPVGLRFPGQNYGAAVNGVFLDGSNLTGSIDGVLFDDVGGSAINTLRSNAALSNSVVYKFPGSGVATGLYCAEIHLYDVKALYNTGSGFFIQCSDIRRLNAQAAWNGLNGFHFSGAAAVIAELVEAWQNEQDNVRFEGFCRTFHIDTLISNDAEQHGIHFLCSGGNGPYQIVIDWLTSNGSSKATNGAYNDVQTTLITSPTGSINILIKAGNVGSSSSGGNLVGSFWGVTDPGITPNYQSLYDFAVDQKIDFAPPPTGVSLCNASALFYWSGLESAIYAQAGSVGWGPTASPFVTGRYNLIQNGRFDYWIQGPTTVNPEAWYAIYGGAAVLDGVGALAKNTVTVPPGSLYSCTVTGGANTGDGAVQIISFPGAGSSLSLLAGRRVTVSGWIYNPTGEATAFNTGVRISDNITPLTFIAPSNSQWTYFEIPMTVSSTAQFISVLTSPALSAPAVGRQIYFGGIKLNIGDANPNVAANPADLDSWTPITLTQSGGNIALDLRYGAKNFIATYTDVAADLIGFVNSYPMSDITVFFKTTNTITLLTSFNLARADGLGTAISITNGMALRFKYCNAINKWLVFVP